MTTLQEVLKSPVEAKENTVAKAKEVLKTVDFSKAELADQLAKMEISLGGGKNAKLIDVVAAIDEENYAAGNTGEKISGALKFKLEGKTYSIGWASEAAAWIQAFLTAKGVGGRLGKTGIDGRIGDRTVHAIDEYMQREQNKVIDKTKKELEDAKEKLKGLGGKKVDWEYKTPEEAEKIVSYLTDEIKEVPFNDKDYIKAYPVLASFASEVKNAYGTNFIDPASHRLNVTANKKDVLTFDINKGTMSVVLKTDYVSAKRAVLHLDDFVTAMGGGKNVDFDEEKFVAAVAKVLERIKLLDDKEKRDPELRKYLNNFSKKWTDIPELASLHLPAGKIRLLEKAFPDDTIDLHVYYSTPDMLTLHFEKEADAFNAGNVLLRQVKLNDVWKNGELDKPLVDTKIANAIKEKLGVK